MSMFETVLKNFSAINNGIYLEEGEIIQTISPAKHIYARTKKIVSPFTFGVYDLNNFLSTLSLTAKNREYTITGVQMKISDGKNTVYYTGADKDVIVTPPDAVSALIEADRKNTVRLSKEDMKQIIQAGQILNADEIEFSFEPGFVTIKTVGDDDANTFSMKTDSYALKESTSSIKYEVLRVIPIDSYKINDIGNAFVFENDDFEYYVAKS